MQELKRRHGNDTEVVTARRRQILDCAAELFARQGVAATTVRQIGEAVGMLSGSLYRYYSSKDEVLAEILGRYLNDLNERYRSVLARDLDPVACLEELVVTSLQTTVRHPHAAEIYQAELPYLRQADTDIFRPILDASQVTQRIWIKVIKSGAEHGLFRDDIPVSTFYRLMRDAVWLSVRWYKPSPSYPIERLARDCTRIFLDGYRQGHP